MNFLLFISVIALTYLLVNAINVWYIKPYEHLKEKYDKLQDAYDGIEVNYDQLETDYDDLQGAYQATVESLTTYENEVKQLRKSLATTKGQLTKLRKLYDRQDNTKIKK